LKKYQGSPFNNALELFSGDLNLVADYSEFQDKIFYQEIEIQQGESLLLCSDGLTDGLSAEVREKIWKQYDNDKSRLTVCRKLIAKQIAYDDLSVIICAF